MKLVRIVGNGENLVLCWGTLRVLNSVCESRPVSQRQSSSCIWAAGGMWSPKPGLFVGALVPEGLASGCRTCGCTLSCGETIIRARGGKRVISCPSSLLKMSLFSTRDPALKNSHPTLLGALGTSVFSCSG